MFSVDGPYLDLLIHVPMFQIEPMHLSSLTTTKALLVRSLPLALLNFTPFEGYPSGIRSN